MLGQDLETKELELWRELLSSFEDFVPRQFLIKCLPERFPSERSLAHLVRSQVLVPNGHHTVSVDSVAEYLHHLESHYTLRETVDQLEKFMWSCDEVTEGALRGHAPCYIEAGLMVKYPPEKGVLLVPHNKLYDIAAAALNRGKPCEFDPNKFKYDPRMYAKLDFAWPSEPSIIVRSVLGTKNYLYVSFSEFYASRFESFVEELQACFESAMDGPLSNMVNAFDWKCENEPQNRTIYIVPKDPSDPLLREYLRCFSAHLWETLPISGLID